MCQSQALGGGFGPQCVCKITTKLTPIPIMQCVSCLAECQCWDFYELFFYLN